MIRSSHPVVALLRCKAFDHIFGHVMLHHSSFRWWSSVEYKLTNSHIAVDIYRCTYHLTYTLQRVQTYRLVTLSHTEFIEPAIDKFLAVFFVYFVCSRISIHCNMNVLLFIGAILSISIVTECNFDPRLLKCLVCRATVKEIEENLGKIDPSRKVEIGNYRLDAEGNAIHKKIPLAQSEVYISDLLDSICEKMSDYVRATYKSNGELTILNLMNSSGGMNPELSKVDIVQDGELNKSLKYYCEGIVEENEDSMISMFRSKESDIKKKLCTDLTNLCSPDDFPYEDEEEEQYDGTSEEHEEL